MLKVAILGAGYMGQLHAKSLLKTGLAEVTAVCSRPFETATALNDNILGGKAATFECFDDMLEQAEFDALYVCLPPFAHNGEILAAAKAKKHLFVEKPLGLDLKKATQMVAVARRARIVTQMGYHMRFGSAVRKLKAMIESGEAGRPTLFHGSFQCNALHVPWWRDVRTGGGQIVEQAIHVYDLAMHLLGKPTTVNALMANLCHRKIKGYTIEDTSAATIGFAGGAMAAITASNCAVPTQWRWPFTVVCEKLTAEFQDHNRAVFTFHGGKPAEEWWPTGKFPEAKNHAEDLDPYLAADTAFLQAVAGGDRPAADLRQGAASLRLVLAARKSAKAGGKPVKL